jgi:hypothetical protein
MTANNRYMARFMLLAIYVMLVISLFTFNLSVTWFMAPL